MIWNSKYAKYFKNGLTDVNAANVFNQFKEDLGCIETEYIENLRNNDDCVEMVSLYGGACFCEKFNEYTNGGCQFYFAGTNYDEPEPCDSPIDTIKIFWDEIFEEIKNYPEGYKEWLYVDALIACEPKTYEIEINGYIHSIPQETLKSDIINMKRFIEKYDKQY